MVDPVIIFMPLLDEGTDVWRPVVAQSLGDGLFRVIEKQRDDETWAFPTGEIVRTDIKTFGDGLERAVAIARDQS